jgi:hypothetical protein
MEYKVVRRSHVVSRGYLRAFAVDEIIAMHLVADSAVREVPINRAGVIKDFYRRHRPDGTPIHDIEWSLEHIDKVVPPLLRQISGRWPLSLEEKAMLAEFVATQVLRGPRWRNWHAAFTADYFTGVRASGEFEGKQPEGTTIEEALNETERQLSSDTATLAKMLELSRKGTQIIGSMHWTLLQFERSWLATSDHPIVLWPLDIASRQPKKSNDFLKGGLLNTLEARFPISPRHALLMTWLDLPDGEAQTVNCTKEIAANLNAFTVAEAEHQWFHVPRIAAPRASGQLLPVAPALLRSYSAKVARESVRRNETARLIQPRIGDATPRAEVELLTIGSTGGTVVGHVTPPHEGKSHSGAA